MNFRYLVLLCLLTLWSCEPTPYYQKLQKLDSMAWSTEQVIDFTTTIEDVATPYELQLVIDHQQDYRYENIYFKIITSFPDREAKEEQLTVNLADKKGIWVGNCSGDNCKCKVFLLDNFKFSTPGEYNFQIGQYTREENLAGINSLELRLYKKTESE